ncbi:hypothetical protein GGR27_000306 [Lewinella antarctica]|uniref:Uncharacterized protein n=1 Tax=Neolewinella antarctica TaxID=442734 RepID=A0ABX0X6H9_9BACT|nr:hypothetical protein [Neolewinella antarctica]
MNSSNPTGISAGNADLLLQIATLNDDTDHDEEEDFL